MKGRRKYRAIAVKNVQTDAIFELAEGRLTIGLDVSKEEIFAVVRDTDGQFLRPWKAKQRTELMELVELFQQVAKTRPVLIGMESTGTYGDAIRQAMTDAKLEVHRVSGKAKSDYEEVFDGVPSAHDGKDAAIVSELVALGKSSPWPYEHCSDLEAEMRTCVNWLDAQQDIYQGWLGRIESLLARHWPEVTAILKLSSVTLLRLLAAYGSPANLTQDPEAPRQLRRWSGSLLKESKIQAVSRSAQTTNGVRMTNQDQGQLQRFADQALAAYREIRKSKLQLKAMCDRDPVIKAMASVIGPTTACVLRVALGDPRRYHCGAAYRKAMGLNLKERSSGKHQGKLKITKRGSSLARRWLYFAALRLIQQSPVRRWYEAKREKDKGFGGRAVVGVMRKLALAIWHVAVHQVPFDRRRLFPGKPLPPPLGALPPDPRDFTHGVESKM